MRSSEISKEIRRSSFDPDTDEFFELTRSDHVEEKLNRSNGTPATQACAFRGPTNNWLLDEDEQSNANDEISDPIAAAEAPSKVGLLWRFCKPQEVAGADQILR